MVVTITATVDAVNLSARLRITGATAGRKYAVHRIVDGAWTLVAAPQTLGSSATISDETCPFQVPVLFRVRAEPSTVPAFPTADEDYTDPFTLPFSGNPVLRAPARPDLGMVRVPLLGYDSTRDMPLSKAVLPASKWPSMMVGRRQAAAGKLVWRTRGDDDRRRLTSLLESGATVLHLRAPCVDGAHDLFFVPLDLEEKIPDETQPSVRDWTVDFQQVPDAALYEVPATMPPWSWADLSGWASWNALKASGKSWDDVWSWPFQTAARTGDWHA